METDIRPTKIWYLKMSVVITEYPVIIVLLGKKT